MFSRRKGVIQLFKLKFREADRGDSEFERDWCMEMILGLKQCGTIMGYTVAYNWEILKG